MTYAHLDQRQTAKRSKTRRSYPRGGRVDRTHDDVTDVQEKRKASGDEGRKKDARNCTCVTNKQRTSRSHEKGGDRTKKEGVEI